MNNENQTKPSESKNHEPIFIYGDDNGSVGKTSRIASLLDVLTALNHQVISEDDDHANQTPNAINVGTPSDESQD